MPGHLATMLLFKHAESDCLIIVAHEVQLQGDKDAIDLQRRIQEDLAKKRAEAAARVSQLDKSIL